MPTADAVGTYVMVLMFGVDEEVVGEILLGEKAIPTGIHHVEPRQAAELLGGRRHGAVAKSRLLTKLRSGTFVVLHCLINLELRILCGV